MDYASTLNPAQKANAALILQELHKQGVNNAFTDAAVLSVCSKESEFNPAASEVGYGHTSNDRIRQIFSKTKSLTDAQLNALKADNKKFFDFVYNGVDGNGPNDGYAFRGRGFNDITGRDNYRHMAALTGIPFETNPDLLADPLNAAKAAAAFFIDGAAALKKAGKLSQYNATSLNDFKNEVDSTGAVYHINAGIGHSKASLDADPTGGKAKAVSRVGSLLAAFGAATSAAATKATEVVKKNPLTTALITAAVIVGTVLLFKTFSTQST